MSNSQRPDEQAMWLNLGDLFGCLTIGDEPMRHDAVVELLRRDLLRRVCEQAVRGALLARRLLDRYSEVLASPGSEKSLRELGREELLEARSQVAAAQDAIRARRDGADRGGQSDATDTDSLGEDEQAWLRSFLRLTADKPHRIDRVEDLLRERSAVRRRAAGPYPPQPKEPTLSRFEPAWIDVLTDDHLNRLLWLLRTQSSRIRLEALQLIWKFSGEVTGSRHPQDWTPRITPAFLDAVAGHFTDADDCSRVQAISAAAALASVRPYLPLQQRLWSALADPVDSVRAAATAAAVLICPLDSILPRLCRLLEDRSVEGRRVAALALASSAVPPSEELTAALRRALASSDTTVLHRVAEVAGGLKPAPPPELIDGLVRLLSDPAASVREAGVNALVAAGDVARTPAVFSGLLGLVEDPAAEVRAAVARAIGDAGQAAPEEWIEALGRLLQDKDERVIDQAAVAVSRIGRSALTPALLEGLAGSMHRIPRPALFDALGALGAAAAIPSILRELARMLCFTPGALEAAQSLGPAAWRQTLALFAGLLRHPKRGVRKDALAAIASQRFALAVPEFLDEIPRLLGDRDADTRACAVAAVEMLGEPAATPAIWHALHQRLTDEDSYVRYKTEQAIKALGG